MFSTVVRLVCLVALLAIASPGTSRAQNLVSYDKFDGPSINQQKWEGFDESGGEGGQNLEVVRQIASGRLSVQLCTAGERGFDKGVHVGLNALSIREPAGISQLAFDVVPTLATSVTDCVANAYSGFSAVGGAAAFYRETTNFCEGADVYAVIRIGRIAGVPTPANRLEIRGFVYSEETDTGDTMLIGEVDLGTIAQNAVARLSIEWDPDTDVIKFQVNNRPIETIQGPESVEGPDEDFKLVGAFSEVEACANQQALGTIRGLIDNVSIKRLIQ